MWKLHLNTELKMRLAVGLVDEKEVFDVKFPEMTFNHGYDPSRSCCRFVTLTGLFEI